MLYVAIGRERRAVVEHVDPEQPAAGRADAIKLGRHVVARADPPGWDDVKRGKVRVGERFTGGGSGLVRLDEDESSCCGQDAGRVASPRQLRLDRLSVFCALLRPGRRTSRLAAPPTTPSSLQCSAWGRGGVGAVARVAGFRRTERKTNRAAAQFRAIKLPVHDADGTSSFVVCFGVAFPEDQAQMFCEKLALMLLPLLRPPRGADDDDDDDGDARRGGADADADAAAQAATLGEILAREVAHANSRGRVWAVLDQVANVRTLMEANVEAILDRQERLEDLQARGEQLREDASVFRQGARKLKRWHLMNQVKWGVAIGTAVTLSVAIPIAVVAAL